MQERFMVPRLNGGRAPLKQIVALLLLSFFLVSHVGAFQTQIQIEAKESGRKIKTRISPEYPELAVKTKLSGIVRVEAVVTPDGSVSQVREIGGNPVLLSALVRAVKQWRYEPAQKESVMEIKAAFNL
jgi:TonB family protein